MAEGKPAKLLMCLAALYAEMREGLLSDASEFASKPLTDCLKRTVYLVLALLLTFHPTRDRFRCEIESSLFTSLGECS